MYLTNTQRSVIRIAAVDLYEFVRDRCAEVGYDDAIARAAHGRANYLHWLSYFLDWKCGDGPHCHPSRCGTPELEANTGYACYSAWHEAEFGDPYDRLRYTIDGELIAPTTI